MDPLLLAALLFGIGVVLIFGELLLPTAGMLGFSGVGLVIAAVVLTFFVNQWLGLGVLVVLLIISPFFASWALRVWPRTPIGKQVVLQPVELSPHAPEVRIGQTGVAVTELRPMGECEFGERRVEARSEYGIIRPGDQVKIVEIVSGRPIVRRMAAAPAEASPQES